MATSRVIRAGDKLTRLYGGTNFNGGGLIAQGGENRGQFVLQSDFGLTDMTNELYRENVCARVFGISDCTNLRDPRLAAAITNGTAPGLYVREGDDTSDWETYRQVLARRVEEAMATRRGGVGGVGAGERAMVAETATSRQDDEIRVGDVVEVVSCSGSHTIQADIGHGGQVSHIAYGVVYVNSVDGMRLPIDNSASLTDVRKVTPPSPPSPQTVVASVSPMPDGEAARIEAAVADEVRRRLSLPLARSSDETTRQRVVNPVPPVVSVNLLPRDFTASAITDYLQSLGASHIRVYQTPENLPVVEVTGLSRQAFDTARQNLPVGVQLQLLSSNWQVAADDRRFATDDRRLSNVPPPSSRPAPQPSSPQPPPPSRFSLLEVDVDTDAAPAPAPQAPKPSTGLVALQQELRAEREAKRALAAAQTPPGRFDLLECDLPAVPTTKAPKAAPQRPVVSSSPKPQPRPVETITDLTAARSPLELARMLDGLNDELSTMMRQREAN